MLDLVRKRHEGDGWLVFSELANKPGGHDRYADGFALGVWASTKYEAHLYEFKASRGDVRKELRDPTKAEGVGKYATYWWLAVEDEKIIRDLVIPEAWGILTPQVRGGHRLLTVVRKAPRLKPAPFSPLFAVSLIRNMAKQYKSNADYDKLREERDAALAKRDIEPPPDIRAKDEQIYKLERELKELRAGLDSFRNETGVDLTEPGLRSFQIGQMGRAFKVARELNHRLLSGNLRAEVAKLSQTSKMLEDSAAEIAETTVALRGLMQITGHAPQCGNWGGRCTCGLEALSEAERKLARNAIADDPRADPTPEQDDDQGSGLDRGGARAPVQDAGVQLRNLGDQVPHG